MEQFRDPRLLPIVNGYEFIGIDLDGNRGNCVVVLDPETGGHYVDGDIKYCYLKHWIEKTD